MTLKEKRQQLKKHATTLGLCNRCTIRKKDPDFMSCTVCRNRALIRVNAYRKEAGRCSRCGQKNDRHETYKTCYKCSHVYQNRA